MCKEIEGRNKHPHKECHEHHRHDHHRKDCHEHHHRHDHHHHDEGCHLHTHHHGHEGACSVHDDGCGCGHHHGEKAEIGNLIGLAVSIVLWGGTLLLQHLSILDGIYLLLLYIAAYLIAGYKVVWNAIKNILRGKVFDEHFLMTIASVGAFCVGEYPEASAVMLFYNLGELIQDYAVRRSRKSITDLMDIRADYAVVIRNGKEEKVDPSEVDIGELMIVRPGEKIAIDGVVEEGTADIDTAALTGETVPKVVQKGSGILAGSVNISGALKIRTVKTAMDSTVSKILKLTEMAVTKKAKSERFITKFAAYYTPIVVLAALLIFVVPTLITGIETYQIWLYRALAFLVTSCPCALVISIPLSFFAGIGGASKLGVLVKGANYIDLASKVKTVVLDKTGTLTKGSFTVKSIRTSDMEEEELKRLLLSVERYSHHPIAIAIQEGLSVNEALYEVSGIKEKAGRGIQGLIEGKSVLAGNERMMKEQGIAVEPMQEYGTAVYLAVDGSYKGAVLLSDTIKDEARQGIEELRALGMENILMLTGDEDKPASLIAEGLHLTSYRAGVLPDEKLKIVQELKQQTEAPVLFVGDGLNDAPVLAISDVGMAMGQIGTDAAIEAADVVLMRDDVTGIAGFIRHSLRTMRIVKQNIVFVLFIKMAVLVLAGMGLVGMWAAIFADVGVALLAVLNAVRAIKIKNSNCNTFALKI